MRIGSSNEAKVDGSGERRQWHHRAAALAGVAALATAGAGLVQATPASASGTADLSVTQAVTSSTVSGQTVMKVTVKNAGPSTATTIDINTLITTPSAGFDVGTSGPSGSSCEVTPPPSGYKALYSCQYPSLASGKSWVLTETLSGTKGDSFKSLALVGDAGPSDPVSTNNTSTLSSYFGPAADLKVTQKATVGAAGKASIVSTTKNYGPSTANALQLITEIDSPGFVGVAASGNVSASCQFIPPASGYNSAVSCTTSALAPGKSWVETFAFTGTAGDSLIQKASASANNPADPVASNNTSTISTHYGS